MVRIQTDLGGQIKSYRQPSCSVGQEVFVQLVSVFGVSHARIVAHGPKPSAIHGWLYAAGEREISRIACPLVVVPVLQISGPVELANWNMRRSFWICGQIAHLRLLGHQKLSSFSCPPEGSGAKPGKHQAKNCVSRNPTPSCPDSMVSRVFAKQ